MPLKILSRARLHFELEVASTRQAPDDPLKSNCPRRKFLATSLATTTALLLGCDNQKAPTTVPAAVQTPPSPATRTGWIDAHTHLWTTDTQKFPLATWTKSAEMQPASFTAEEWFQLARPVGVERAVLVQHSPFYGYDSSYLLDCCQRYPGTFSLIGQIDERLPDLAKRLRQQRNQGLRGLRITPTNYGDRTAILDPPNWLKAPEMQKLWRAAADQDVAICPLLYPKFLPSLDPMCQEFPQVKCVIDHLGHVDITQEDQIADLLRLSRHPNVYVKVSGFYKFGAKRPPYLELDPLIQRLVISYGAARLMWGSDCPYQLKHGNTFQDSVDLVAKRLDWLASADRQKMLRDTAAKLFFT